MGYRAEGAARGVRVLAATPPADVCAALWLRGIGSRRAAASLRMSLIVARSLTSRKSGSRRSEDHFAGYRSLPCGRLAVYSRLPTDRLDVSEFRCTLTAVRNMKLGAAF